MATDEHALILQISAQLTGLEKAFKKAEGIVDSSTRRMQDRGTGLEKFFERGDFGKGLDKIFDATRFKVLDSGAARVGVFGSALETMGAAGLVTAGILGTVALALKQAGDAAKFADQLEDTAKRLHVTTDALQEYRYAIFQAGGSEEGADQALEAFSVNLGKAQEGLLKSQRAFKALGFTTEQIKSFKTVDEALLAVTRRIGELKNNPQKDALIEQLGLEGIKPLVLEGVDAMEALRRKAHDIGLVMDEGLIKRGAAANKQFEVLSKIIDVQLKSAFVDLAPVLVKIVGLAADLARGISDIVDKLRAVENRTTAGLGREQAEIAGQLTRLEPQLRAEGGAGAGTTLARGLITRSQAIHAELQRRFADAANAPAPPTGTRDLVDQGHHGGPSAQQQQKKTDELIAKAQLALLAATDNERHSVEERADVARARLEQEIAARDVELDDLVATKAITPRQRALVAAKDREVFAAKRRELEDELAQKLREAQLRSERDLVDALDRVLTSQEDLATNAADRGAIEAKILENERTIERKTLAEALADDPNKTAAQKAQELAAFDAETANRKAAQARQASQAVQDEINAQADAQLQNQIDLLQAIDGLAKTAAERRAIELRILELTQQLERQKLQEVIDSKTASDAEKAIARARMAELPGIEAAQRQGVVRSTFGPLDQLRDSIPQTAAEMNQALEDVASRGLQQLTDGLVAAAQGTEKLGDVFKNVARQILADLLKIELEKAIVEPLANALGFLGLGSSTPIPGHASGTDSFGGGFTRINEAGPEGVAFLPRGTKIIPNDVLRALASMKAAGGGSASVIRPAISFDLRGAVVTEDLLAQMNRLAAGAEARAVSRSLGLGQRALPTSLRSDALLRQ
jgi:hypothetical protein